MSFYPVRIFKGTLGDYPAHDSLPWGSLPCPPVSCAICQQLHLNLLVHPFSAKVVLKWHSVTSLKRFEFENYITKNQLTLIIFCMLILYQQRTSVQQFPMVNAHKPFCFSLKQQWCWPCWSKRKPLTKEELSWFPVRRAEGCSLPIFRQWCRCKFRNKTHPEGETSPAVRSLFGNSFYISSKFFRP